MEQLTAFRRLTPLPTLQAEGVKLVPAGKDRYRCACPVHRGDKLSMAVSDNGKRWTLVCHACGFVGGAIDLVRALTGVSFVEAVKQLGGTLERSEACPVDLHPVDYVVLACDAAGCSNSMRIEAATYKTPGRSGGLHTRTSTDEVFTRAALAGWELSAFGEFAICADCLLRASAPERALSTDRVASARRGHLAGVDASSDTMGIPLTPVNGASENTSRP